MLSSNNRIVPRETTTHGSTAEARFLRRTDSGAAEILQDLTQGERLVLILIEGGVSYDQLRRKLSGLSEARFTRALSGLLSMGLVEDANPGAADSSLHDRFPSSVTTPLRLDFSNSLRPPPIEMAGATLNAYVPREIGVELDVAESLLKRGVVDFYLPLEREMSRQSNRVAAEFATHSQRLSPLTPAYGRRRDDAVTARAGADSHYRVHTGHWLTLLGLASAMLLLIVQVSR